MKRGKALVIAVFVALTALMALGGSAQAAALAVGQKVTSGAVVYTITAVDAPKHSAKTKSATGVIACFTDIKPTTGTPATGKIGTKTVWKYTCPTSVPLTGTTLRSRAW